MTVVFEYFSVLLELEEVLVRQKNEEGFDVLDRVEVHIHEEEDETTRQRLVLHYAEALGERPIDTSLRMFGQQYFEIVDRLVVDIVRYV